MTIMTAGTLGALPHVPFSSDLETLNVLVDDWIRLSDEYFSFNCIQSSQARSTLFYFRVWVQRLGSDSLACTAFVNIFRDYPPDRYNGASRCSLPLVSTSAALNF